MNGSNVYRTFHGFLQQGNMNHPRGEPFYCAFDGPSMLPTLSRRDLLIIGPYKNRTPRVGDVVIFTTPDFDQPVVHRIVGRKNGRFRTRGDNCSDCDRYLVAEQDIIGRVTGAAWGRRERAVTGGISGMAIHSLCRLRMTGRSVLTKLARPVRHLQVHAVVQQRGPADPRA